MSTESENTTSTRELKLMQQVEKLKNELADLNILKATNERLVNEKEELNKEYQNFKKDIDTKDYFKSIGGKDDYLNEFKKLWDGNKFNEASEAAFKERLSNMFNKEEIKAGSPANAIAGEAKGDSLKDVKEDGATMEWTNKDGGVPAQ